MRRTIRRDKVLCQPPGPKARRPRVRPDGRRAFPQQLLRRRSNDPAKPPFGTQLNDGPQPLLERRGVGKVGDRGVLDARSGEVADGDLLLALAPGRAAAGERAELEDREPRGQLAALEQVLDLAVRAALGEAVADEAVRTQQDLARELLLAGEVGANGRDVQPRVEVARRHEGARARGGRDEEVALARRVAQLLRHVDRHAQALAHLAGVTLRLLPGATPDDDPLEAPYEGQALDLVARLHPRAEDAHGLDALRRQVLRGDGAREARAQVGEEAVVE